MDGAHRVLPARGVDGAGAAPDECSGGRAFDGSLWRFDGGVSSAADQSLIDTVHGFLASLGMDAQYYRIMLKTMGIALTTQIAMQVCQDLDAPSIARRAEFCGRVALMSVAVPVFVQLTQMAVGALR